MTDFLPQIIGLLAVILFLLSYQQKKRMGIILLNASSRILYIVQYLMLGAFAGASLDVLGTISSLLSAKRDTPFLKKHLTAVIISLNLLMIGVGGTIAVINESPIDIFSLLGVLLHTGAFWMRDEKIIRRISLMGSPCWLIYNLSSCAYGSAIGDILSISSIIIAMIRLDRKKK